jgi:hypothetical protein
MTKKKGESEEFFIPYNLFINVLPILKFGKICNFRTPISIWVSPFCGRWNIPIKMKCIYSK